MKVYADQDDFEKLQDLHARFMAGGDDAADEFVVALLLCSRANGGNYSPVRHIRGETVEVVLMGDNAADRETLQ